MKETVSFSKEIDFKTMLDKVTSISLEHTLSNDDESIKGDLIISGTYRETPASQIDTPFSYKIPVDVVLDSKYDLDNLTIDIDDFTYEVVDDNKLKINVDLLLDNLSIKEQEENKDELVTYDDLFLEKEDCKKLEVEEQEKPEQKQEDNSLFTNMNSNNETYKVYSIYIIRENDTIDDILKKYNVTKEVLEEYNDLSDMKIGTKIIIPSNIDE